MRSDKYQVITSEVCEECNYTQYFSLADLERSMSQVTLNDGSLSYEGWWNCNQCNFDNSCVSEVSI